MKTIEDLDRFTNWCGIIATVITLLLAFAISKLIKIRTRSRFAYKLLGLAGFILWGLIYGIVSDLAFKFFW